MYFILDDSIASGITTVTNLSITVDGLSATPFVFTPSGADDYVYNALVYSSLNMQLQDHIVLLSSRGDQSPSLLLFDYAVYT